MTAEAHSYSGPKPGTGPLHNAEVDWRRFGPKAYWAHNYSYLRKDDQEIIQAVGAHFSDHFAARRAEVGRMHGVDVGSGSNLYPALGLLPWCSRIDLIDFSASNCDWLRTEIAEPRTVEGEWPWRPFWREFCRFPGYDPGSDPAGRLAEAGRVQVHEMSVMDLPPRRWNLGTMFFVAESMTSYPAEFEDATKKFMASLEPGAPFAAAFMDGSKGYVVDEESFPAVREVDSDRVELVLGPLAGEGLRVEKIAIPPLDSLREDYDGMIVAVGTTAT